MYVAVRFLDTELVELVGTGGVRMTLAFSSLGTLLLFGGSSPYCYFPYRREHLTETDLSPSSSPPSSLFSYFPDKHSVLG